MHPRRTNPTQSSMSIVCLGLALLAGCQSTQLSGNAILVEDVTTKPNDLTLTLRVGMTVTVTGMRVDTIGEDTVVTRVNDDRARRFILAGLVGYRGRIGLHSVDLVVGETSLWIDDHSVKMHGPDGTIDMRLLDNAGADVFEGRDPILAGNKVEPAESRRE